MNYHKLSVYLPAALFCYNIASLGFNSLTRSFPPTYPQLKLLREERNVLVNDRIPNEPHMWGFITHFSLCRTKVKIPINGIIASLVFYKRQRTVCCDFRDEKNHQLQCQEIKLCERCRECDYESTNMSRKRAKAGPKTTQEVIRSPDGLKDQHWFRSGEDLRWWKDHHSDALCSWCSNSQYQYC